MYPTEKMAAFEAEVLRLVELHWDWADDCVESDEVSSKPSPGYIPLTDGGKKIIIQTSLYDCPLPVTTESRQYHLAGFYERGDEYEDEDEDTWLMDCPLCFKINAFYLCPGGNMAWQLGGVAEESITLQSYLSFDEYGRDHNYDIVGFGYSSSMTIPGLHYKVSLEEFDPIKDAEKLFNFLNEHPSHPLRPQKI
jgi:hypothetical protein